MRQVCRRAAALAMAVGLFSGLAQAADQSADPVARECAKVACRMGGFEIAVFFDKDDFTSIKVTHSPYVLQGGEILIFPGETLVFELPLDGDKIGTPKFLGEYLPEFPMLRDPNGPPAPPSVLTGLDKSNIAANTLILSYGQRGGQGKSDPSMMLTLWQNLPKTVKLEAIMAVIRPRVSEYQQAYTSTCPLMPKLSSFENWAQPLGPMILRNFRVQPDNGTMLCN